MNTSARWLRWGVAFVWLWTGLAVLHPHYRALGESYLAPLGVPPWVMYATCVAEVLLGLRVALGRAATWLTVLQVVLIVGFTLVLSVTQPALWLDPLGFLTKNLALLVMIGAAWLLECGRRSDRGALFLRLGLGGFWVVQGALAFLGLYDRWSEDSSAMRSFACLEVFLGLLALLPPSVALLLAVAVYLVSLTLISDLHTRNDPLLWFHPFGPLTKNAAVVVAALVLVWVGWTARTARRYDDPRGSASRR